jgi:hypothetical protein
MSPDVPSRIQDFLFAVSAHSAPLILGSAVIVLGVLDMGYTAVRTRFRYLPPIGRRLTYTFVVSACVLLACFLAFDELQVRYADVRTRLTSVQDELARVSAHQAELQATRDQADTILAAHWEPLNTDEVTRLRNRLGGAEPMPITIYCNDINCKDLANSMAELFRASGWSADVSRSVIDLDEGITVAPDNSTTRALGEALEAGTQGRLKINFLKSDINQRIYLDIGSRPR